ncbi:MAG: hypothetical protein N2258_04375 [Brevinematales bacterium]|nr:hypothetical protein [Brevinematales bacterium]
MKQIFIFLLFLFVYSCQGSQGNTPTNGIVSTNYQNMITIIEQEDKGESKTIYIDGNINSIYSISSVNIFCYTKSGKFLEKKEGTYNAENFAFNLNLKKGSYLITIEATDVYGNKYIQKNVLLTVK